MNRRAVTPPLEVPAVLSRGADEKESGDVTARDPFEDEVEPFAEVDADDEEAIDRAMTSVREGKGIPLDEFLVALQRA